MAKYTSPKLTRSQYLFLIDAMRKVLPDCLDIPREEKMWLETHEALMEAQLEQRE